MDNATAASLRERLVFSATRKGAAERAEDDAHDALVEWLSGKRQHQSVDQAVIEAYRRVSGRPGAPGYERKRNLNLRAERMDALEDFTSPSIDHDSPRDFERLIQPLRPIQRAVVCLIYLWGFSEIEVAHCFGVTESRVSQRLKGVQRTISGTMAGKEYREAAGILDTIREKAAGEPGAAEEEPGGVAGVCETERQEMECGTNQGMEAEESWQVEGFDEESFPEWFA